MTMESVASDIRELAADTRKWDGETMQCWDRIRRDVETMKGSDLPGLSFEALTEQFADALDLAADEIERLRAALQEADSIIKRMDEDETWLWPEDLRDGVGRSLGRFCQQSAPEKSS